jgi:transcription elongation GreA/GreB family factor
MLDKKRILNELVTKAKNDFEGLKAALGTTKGHASDSEMKAEGKYDTRSIEAGYLAGAQKVRVDELENEVKLLEEINLNHNNDNICVGSLVEIELNNQKRLYFISSTSGGTILNIDNNPILVISAFSPIGDCAIGLSKGDTFDIENKNGVREYTICNIW